MPSLGHGAGLGSQVVVGLDVVLHASNNQVVVVTSAVYSVDKVPGANISILLTIGVVPCIEQRISGSFHQLMSNDTDSRVNCSIAIGRGVLSKAVAARGWDSNPTVLVAAIVGVPATKLSAETRLSNITNEIKNKCWI